MIQLLPDLPRKGQRPELWKHTQGTAFIQGELQSSGQQQQSGFTLSQAGERREK